MSNRLSRACLVGCVSAAALVSIVACGSSGSSGAKAPGVTSPDGGVGGAGQGGSGNGGSGAKGGSGNGGKGQDAASLPPTAGTFNENFDWKGTHAAVVNSGKGTTVWWNADNWDVSGDTHAIAVMGQWSNTPSENASGITHDTNSGHSVYVYKAKDACNATATAPCTGAMDEATLTPGGDGTQGIGIIDLDEQDITGARLRTPIAISEDKPGVIRMRAPRFVTSGGWWELALTPGDRVIGSENTVVESQGQQDGLAGAADEPNQPGKGAGPGHDPQEESFNIVATGVTDFACETEAAMEGNLTRLAVKSLIKGADASKGYQTQTGVRFNTWNPKSIFNSIFHGNYQEDLIRPGLDGTKPVPDSMLKSNGDEDTDKVVAANLSDEDNLYLWEFTIRPSGVDVKADFNDGRGLAQLEHFNLGVPWTTAYVHIMGVAYQNDHHPQVQQNCAYLPDPFTRRQIKFRSISVGPVLYAKTKIFPPDGAPTDGNGNVLLCNNGGSCGRWMNYDMRDTRNFGADDTVAGTAFKKANKKSFSFDDDYAHGSNGHLSGLSAEQSFDLYVPVTDDVSKAKAANFVYNVLGAKGVATLFVNGTKVGTLPTADTVVGAWVRNDISSDTGCPDYDCMSVRRSVAIDPAVLNAGITDNLVHLQVVFDQAQLGKGTFIDRIQLETMQ